jgi:hypothetical protein
MTARRHKCTLSRLATTIPILFQGCHTNTAKRQQTCVKTPQAFEHHPDFTASVVLAVDAKLFQTLHDCKFEMLSLKPTT